MDARCGRLRHVDAAVRRRGPRPLRAGAFAGESDGPGPGVAAMPSFLASVAEIAVSCPVRRTRHRRVGAAAAASRTWQAVSAARPAYDIARAYNATHKAPGGISMPPQHLRDARRPPAPFAARRGRRR